ncbi:MAG: glycosyltransferase family 4 protein [Verrucomicrobiales bacterium]|nr:glycosyltransferase family 4 protein [Verrucomicrobiales bacterium]
MMEASRNGEWMLRDRWDPECDADLADDGSGLPRALLYATSAALGGTGLDSTSLEGALAAAQGGFLKEALAFGGNAKGRLGGVAKSLNWHPVRLLSALESPLYYGAKKRYTARHAAWRLRRGAFDFFHGWSGDAFAALVEARRQGVPSVIDIPTWHRNKGQTKPAETRSERERRLGPRLGWREQLPVTRLEMLAEYDLADGILVPSACSARTFLAAGIEPERLHYVGRGVDVARYRPAEKVPERFRAIFVGALIHRKGVHRLLEAWKKAGLKDAELLLIGQVHEEVKPDLARWADASVKVPGFSRRIQDDLRESSLFVFPSECEGFAKSTLEAAACGLPILGTRESGDAIVDGETGRVVAVDDVEALVAGLREAAENRDAWAAMGRAGRARVERCLTWDHYRGRILRAYREVNRQVGRGGE